MKGRPLEYGAHGPWRLSGALSIMARLEFGRFSYTMLLPSTREGLGLTYTGAGFLAIANMGGYRV